MHSVGVRSGFDRRLWRRWERGLGDELHAARVGAAGLDTDHAADGNDHPDDADHAASHHDPDGPCQDGGLLAYQR